MTYGYVNPTREFSESLQIENLKFSGAKELYIEEKVKKNSRDQLDLLLGKLQKGDTIKVYSIFALPLTTLEMIKIFDELNEKKVDFDSINEYLGDCKIYSILASHAKYTRKVRSIEGLESARARGRKGGRKPGLSQEAEKTAVAAASLYHSSMSINDIIQRLNIGSRSTLYRYLRHSGIEIKGFKKVS